MVRAAKLVCLLTICSFFQARAQTLKVATYNIRLDYRGDSLNQWQYRRDILCDLVKYYAFDVFGVQEGFNNQMNDMAERLPGFAYLGAGRDDGDAAGEYSGIFYRKSRLKVLGNNTFWLKDGDTTKPGKGWDAAYIRICTWALFEDRATGKKFYHINTHLDNTGVLARRMAAKQILEKVKAAAKQYPVIVTGDLNSDQYSESYQLLNQSGMLSDAFNKTTQRLATGGTFNNWNIREVSNKRIDHIFTGKEWKVLSYGILNNTFTGRLPSDHYPVMVECELK